MFGYNQDLPLISQLVTKVRIKLANRFLESTKGRVFESILRVIENFYCLITGKELIECFGDSHARVFWGLNQHQCSEKYYFRVVSVRGATALGLANPNSQTNALNVFKYWLSRVPHDKKVLFLMGEVDVGFLLWLRAKKYDRSPEQCLSELIRMYTEFLQEVRQEHKQLLVCSAPLPTLKNYDFMGDDDVAVARREVNVGQLERTRMALRFNHYLKKWAVERGVVFLDLDYHSYDASTGLVKEYLVNKYRADHHYHPEAYRKVLLEGMLQSGALPLLNS